ncbi:MAG: biotin/lipoyl-binding protein, partial [Lacipirellulaceae bacterium]
MFCAQYYHPLSSDVRVFQKVVPVIPQMKQAGRVVKIAVQPNVPVSAGDVLFEVDPVPYRKTVDRLEATVKEAEQSVGVAQSSIEIAQAGIRRAQSDLEFMTRERERQEKLLPSGATTEEKLEQTITRYQQAVTTLEQAKATEKQSLLSVELANAKLSQAQASLESAKYDLQQTTVLAPGNGFVTNLQLQEGMLVGGPGAGSVMSFVRDSQKDERGVVVALIDQKNYLLIEPGHYAEVVLNGYPGEVFRGRVLTLIDISGAGQLLATGDLPEDLGPAKPSKFAVRIQIDEAEDLRLPAGSNGLAAIYTNHVPIAGIPVMFV